MVPLIYLYLLAASLLAIGLAGIASDRHLIVIMLSVELIFAASIVLLVGIFSYSSKPNPDAVIMLFSIFAVAAAEVITVISFYMYMKHNRIEFDVTKLSKLKW